jgi:hypothetical protein
MYTAHPLHLSVLVIILLDLFGHYSIASVWVFRLFDTPTLSAGDVFICRPLDSALQLNAKLALGNRSHNHRNTSNPTKSEQAVT